MGAREILDTRPEQDSLEWTVAHGAWRESLGKSEASAACRAGGTTMCEALSQPGKLGNRKEAAEHRQESPEINDGEWPQAVGEGQPARDDS
jgi:hypothetical protein